MKKIIFLILMTTQYVLGQQIERDVVSNGGGYYETESYKTSWTVGESAIKTYETATLILNQGFQQGDIEIETSIIQLQINELEIKVYPNPTYDLISLEIINQVSIPDLKIQLLDISGKLLLSKVFKINKTEIEMNKFVSGMYILKIIDSAGRTKNITIQKK